MQFFKDLQADNAKGCPGAHNAFYETSVRELVAALPAELGGEFGNPPGSPPGKTARAARHAGGPMAA